MNTCFNFKAVIGETAPTHWNQVHRFNTFTGERTGLELSLRYDIITKGHGEKFNVECREGEYTCSTVSLPVHNPASVVKMSLSIDF